MQQIESYVLTVGTSAPIGAWDFPAFEEIEADQPTQRTDIQGHREVAIFQFMVSTN